MLREIIFLCFIASYQCQLKLFQLDYGEPDKIGDDSNGFDGTNTDEDIFKADNSGSIYKLEYKTDINKSKRVTATVNDTNPTLNTNKQKELEYSSHKMTPSYDSEGNVKKESVKFTTESVTQIIVNESVSELTPPYTMDINYDNLQNFKNFNFKNGSETEAYLNNSETECDTNTFCNGLSRNSDTHFDSDSLFNVSNNETISSTPKSYTKSLTESNAEIDFDSFLHLSFANNIPLDKSQIDIPSLSKDRRTNVKVHGAFSFGTFTFETDHPDLYFTNTHMNSETDKETDKTILETNSNNHMELKSKFLKMHSNNGLNSYSLVSNSSDLTEAKLRPVIFASPIVHDGSDTIALTGNVIQNAYGGKIPGFAKSTFVGVPMKFLLSFLGDKSTRATYNFNGDGRSMLRGSREIHDDVVSYIKESARNIGDIVFGHG